MIPWKDNLQKHSNSLIKLETLLKLTNYTKDQSEIEYNTVIQLINNDVKDNVPVSGARILEKLYEAKLY